MFTAVDISHIEELCGRNGAVVSLDLQELQRRRSHWMALSRRTTLLDKRNFCTKMLNLYGLYITTVGAPVGAQSAGN